MHKLIELKEMLCKQLEEYSSKELTAGSLDVVDKLAHAIKNLCKIIEAYEEEEYSGNYGGSYGGMNHEGSYARGGGSYARGMTRGRSNTGRSYARGGRRGGANQYGSYNSGYSREDGYSMAAEDMMEELRELMQEAPDEKTRQMLQQTISKMEQM